jgi:N-acetylglucosamine kinase-like BadF-type ATPase
MTVLAGADAGASRTTAFVADGALKLLGRASGGAGAIGQGATQDSADAILDTVRRALTDAGANRAAALVVGAAGAGREPERTGLEGALRAAALADHVRVTTDGEIALVAAFGEGPGILLLAGTGSGACARLPSGDIRRTGGHGWQFGDEGSGYALARSALAAVARASDGRGPGTALMDALTQAARLDTVDALLRWARGAPRAAVAEMAAAVQRTALNGDPVARQLVEDAARDLVAHVGPLRSHFPAGRSVPVSMAGGLVGAGTLMRQAVTRNLRRDPGLTLLDDPVAPPLGALQLARRLIAG